MRALAERLNTLNLMSEGDGAILEALHRQTIDYAAGTMIQRENAPIEFTRFIVSGWAIKFRTTAEGERQIINFLLPGDSIGLYGALFPSSDSGVEVITDTRLAEIPSIELMDVFRASARLGAALCWIAGQDERFLEQQILRIGALHAVPRLAHLLVELQLRLLRAGKPPAQASTMFITQKLIAEALGISHVHANRCCRELAKRGLIETSSRSLTLLDPGELKRLCAYDGAWGLAQIPEASIQRLKPLSA